MGKYYFKFRLKTKKAKPIIIGMTMLSLDNIPFGLSQYQVKFMAPL